MTDDVPNQGPDQGPDQGLTGAEPDDASSPRLSGAVPGIRKTRRVMWIAVAVAAPVLMLVVVLASNLDMAGTREVRSPLLGKSAPMAEAPTIDGEVASLAELEGEWVVVNFFATWCVPCRVEHDDLVQFHDAHQAVGDASVLGVVFSDSVQAVREFRDDEGGSWPMLTDPDGRIALDFGVSGVPESFLVDPEGTVRSKILGGVRAADLDELLAEAKRGG